MAGDSATTLVLAGGVDSSVDRTVSGDALSVSSEALSSATTASESGFTVVSGAGCSLVGVGALGTYNSSVFSIGFKDLQVKRYWIGCPSIN